MAVLQKDTGLSQSKATQVAEEWEEQNGRGFAHCSFKARWLAYCYVVTSCLT